LGEILDGKKLARELGEKLGSEVASLKEQGVSPKLCVINIGDDPASKVYVASKKRKAEKLGIKQVVYQLPADESEEDVLKLIDSLNADPEVSSLMVQLPVPPQINADRVIERIDPEKDVDCLLRPISAASGRASTLSNQLRLPASLPFWTTTKLT